MTRHEFLDAVRNEKIRHDAFNFDEDRNDCLILDKDGYRWIVYYSDRGNQYGKKYFSSESDALEYLLEELKSDAAAKLKS